MKRFIKTAEAWVMSLRSGETLSEEEKCMFHERLARGIVTGKTKAVKYAGDVNRFPDYVSLAKKHGQIFIWENGSYCIGLEPEEETFSSWFPTSIAEIAICENDAKPEEFWVRYLTEEFPNKKIKTI
jgi:hypothetical protein